MIIFYDFDEHCINRFYLFYSFNAKQLGLSSEGINGFLKADIIKVLNDAKSRKCIICKGNNASTKCSKCPKWMHYTCGKRENLIFNYKKIQAFCKSHTPKSKYKVKFEDRICMAGCHDKVEQKEQSIVSPCCERIYHSECLQNMSLHYGRSHFKCPMCNDKDKFLEECLNNGLYVPEKDADWERPEEENFYQYQAMGKY